MSNVRAVGSEGNVLVGDAGAYRNGGVLLDELLGER
jgi:hypothetical protein